MAGKEEFVLSDEEEELPPEEIKLAGKSSESGISMEKFNELLGEFDREKKARIAAENSKSELEVRFNRLKALAHEAIKKRDEANKEREETVRANEKLSNELMEVNKAKDKNFSGRGLPRSQKYTGLLTVDYGVIKRTNEIVDEVVKQIDSITKSRDEAREMMEQRNYEIAIEVSEMEAMITGIEFKFDHVIEDASKEGAQETKDDEIYAPAGPLESIIKEAQLQIIELQHSVDELRSMNDL
ncbi:hypothetical protein BVRB_6g147140 isoform A [Beta vulgaris subsp. vulgaris]|nr:hypothetical protein BVRB_6g147140 isoform A [Beta vulgaris subsp. vulgaris]